MKSTVTPLFGIALAAPLFFASIALACPEHDAGSSNSSSSSSGAGGATGACTGSKSVSIGAGGSVSIGESGSEGEDDCRDCTLDCSEQCAKNCASAGNESSLCEATCHRSCHSRCCVPKPPPLLVLPSPKKGPRSDTIEETRAAWHKASGETEAAAGFGCTLSPAPCRQPRAAMLSLLGAAFGIAAARRKTRRGRYNP